jgi:hypothetical protein
VSTPTTEPRSIDVPLGHVDKTLRVSLVEDEHGASVVLASGYGGGASGRAFHRPGWSEPPLSLPAVIVPQLVAALGQLVSEPVP